MKEKTPQVTAPLLDLFHGEELLIKTLKQMLDAVTSPELYAILDQHLAETRQQRQRLLPILDRAEEGVEVVEPSVKKLVDEVTALLAKHIAGGEGDSQLIEMARRIEKHEIERYQQAQAAAETSGDRPLAEQLQTSLAEEIHADQVLASLQAELVLDEDHVQVLTRQE